MITSETLSGRPAGKQGRKKQKPSKGNEVKGVPWRVADSLIPGGSPEDKSCSVPWREGSWASHSHILVRASIGLEGKSKLTSTVNFVFMKAKQLQLEPRPSKNSFKDPAVWEQKPC